MKYLLLIILSVACTASVFSQESSNDSTFYKQTTIPPNTSDSTTVQNKENPQKVKNKEGFGEILLSLGKGFLDRLKYRFNLEAIEDKVNNAKKKLKQQEKKDN